MPRSQISFQLATPLLDFILFYFGYLFHHGWISFIVAFTSVATSLTHIISVTPYIADFISAYNSIQDFISFPTSIFFPNTPIPKGLVYLSLNFSPFCLSLSLFVFLGFWFLWLQRVSAASLQQISPPASLQQVSLASFYQVYFKKASLRTKEGPSTRVSVPELCRCKMWFPIFV